MKRIIVAIMLGVMVPVMSLAQELVVEEEKPLSGYDGGFYIKTRDDAFKLQFNGRAQLQYRYVRKPNAPDDSTFMLRRGLLAATATFFEKFEVAASILAGTTSGFTYATPGGGTDTHRDQILLSEFTGTLNLYPALSIQVGDVYLPMDRMGETSSKSRLFVEVPLTATQSDGGTVRTIARNPFGTDQDMGVRINGDISKFSYSIGAVNGSGGHAYNANNELNYGLRLVYNILGNPGYTEGDFGWSEDPQLAIGGGAVYEDEDAVDSSTGLPLLWALSTSGDAAFKWRGFTILGDVYMRKLRSVSGGSNYFNLDDFGYYVHSSYFVVPKKLELGGRIAQIFREGPLNDSQEYGGVVNYYINGYNVRWQTDYTLVRDYEQNIGTVAVGSYSKLLHRVRSMITLSF